MIIDWLKHLFNLFRSRRIRSTDTGIFDPYVPISSLQPIKGDQFSADSDESQAAEELPESGSLYIYFRIVVVLLGAVLIARLGLLQIVQGQENYSLAEGNRLRDQAVPAPRGLFYDRNGTPLVKNTPSFSVIIQPSGLPRSPQALDEYLAKVAPIVNLSASELKNQINANKKKGDLALLEGIDRDRALSLQLRLNGLEGIYLAATPIRQYIDLPSLGHIIGYIGKVSEEDKKKTPSLLSTGTVGKSGLEKEYDRYLQGQPGIETLEVDSRGQALRTIGSKPAEPGQSLILSLDSNLQRVAATALKDSIDKNGAHSGAAVVMDVTTGEILSMVSFPAFDNNLFGPLAEPSAREAVLHDPLSPLINRATSGLYPSGSTIKPVIATAALEQKVISSNTKIDTSAGKITVGPWTFSDWKTHGSADVKQAIAESNNIFFYTIGGGHGSINGLGAEKLAGWMQRFGFGKPTGIDLPEEAKGNVPTPDWKKKVKKEAWYIGDTYNLSIGQGDLLITPLQLTRATAAIANGGKLLQPRLLRTVMNKNGSATDTSPVVADGQVAGRENLNVVREGMRQTVLTGSARSFNTLSVEVAAKTGTAQITASKEKTHSWFTAFAPYNDPRFAVSVIVEGGGEGYVVAAPVAKNIIESYFHLPLTPIVPAPVQAD